MKIKACKVSWSSVCAANCRAKKWDLRLPGHLLLKFGVWEMAAMSSIGCFHNLPLSTLISVSETDSSEAEDTLTLSQGEEYFTETDVRADASGWRQTQMGRYTDWHGAAESRVRPHPLRRTETNPSGRITYWYSMYVLAGSLVLIHISAAACPGGRWRILNMDLRFNNFSTKLATTVILTSVRISARLRTSELGSIFKRNCEVNNNKSWVNYRMDWCWCLTASGVKINCLNQM